MTQPIDRRQDRRPLTTPELPFPQMRAPTCASAPGLAEREQAQAQAAVDRFLGDDNLWLSDADEDALLQHLGATDAEGFEAVVATMSEPQLSRLTTSIDDEQRSALLRLATRSGLVSESGGAPRAGAFDPPCAPRFLHNDPSLPAPLREAIHDENLVRADRYEEAYADYHQRWADAFHEAPTMAARRQLGPPVPYAMPTSEPGVAGADALATDMVGDWVHRPRAAGHFDHATYRAVTYAVAEDQHRAVGGSLEFFAEMEASLALNVTGDGGPSLGLSAKGEVSTRGDGRVRDPQTSTSVTSGAGPVSVKRDAEGTSAVALSAGGQIGVEAEIKRQADGTLDGEAYGKLGPAKIGVSDKGQVVVAVSEEIAVEGDLGSAKLAGTAGARFNPAASPEMLQRALQDHGRFFEAPPELVAGTAWDELPADRRENLHRVLGWTGGEWGEARSLRAADTRPLLR